MTLKRLMKDASDMGMSVRKRDGEYRVTVKCYGRAKATLELAERIAYYTNDIDDAYATMVWMSREPLYRDVNWWNK